MNAKLIETLAKVIAAAGWADQTLSSEEIANLKDLLFRFQQSLPDMRESARFDMYMEAPIEAEERERLVKDLREEIESEEDKEFVLSALQSMVEADGKITQDEQAVLNDIRAQIESVDTGILGDLGRLVRGALQRRSAALSNTPNREDFFEDFLQNKIYYEVRRRLELGDEKIELPEETLRKLSAAGGMMARVANIDGIIIEKEIDQITAILQSSWGLSREAAAFVLQVAMSETSRDFDYLRMSREFVDLTEPVERANLLDVLFVVANADGQVSGNELKEIRIIADYLLLSDNRVEEARAKFAR